MRIIGLTGTIGSGKSTVTGWLAELGAHTIDADALVHRLYATDRDLQQRLQERFGPAVVAQGAVDRAALARIVFRSPEALADLEALVHPRVHALEDQEVARARRAGAPACVIEAIRLIESGGSARCDELWIVVASERAQLARLQARGMSEAEARRRLAVQGTPASWTQAFLAESERLGRPRPVIIFDNSGTLEQGRALAARLWQGMGANV
jgi:dephospho-CoA kinase